MNNLTILIQLPELGKGFVQYLCTNQFEMPNDLKGLFDLFKTVENKFGIETTKCPNILNYENKTPIAIYAVELLNALKTYEIQTWQIKAFIAFLRNIPKKTYLFLYWH